MASMAHLSGQAAIVGYGDAYSSPHEPLSPMNLAVTAALRCMKDAGVPRNDIDGLLTGREPFGDYRAQWNMNFASELKLTPQFSTQVTLHSAGVNAMLKHALLAVTSGAADYVICVQSDGGMAYADLPRVVSLLDAQPEFELPYGPSMTALYAMVCRRYMHEYGVSLEDLAAACVAHQEWGRHHPEAENYSKGPITVEDVVGSREIASPLREWMCSPSRRAGTAGAFLVTSAERAEDLDSTPIYILGVGEASGSEYLIDRLSLRGSHPLLGEQPTLTRTGAMSCVRDAYEMVGVSAADMQIVQSSSGYAHVSMMMLEDLGFCGKGEAADFIADGHTLPGGSLPYNTNGGMLSFGQSGGSCVMDGIMELVRQLRGEALGLQVNCDIGLAHAVGGPLSCHSAVILSGRQR